MSRGGSTTQLQPDPRCTTCTAGASGDLQVFCSHRLHESAACLLPQPILTKQLARWDPRRVDDSGNAGQRLQARAGAAPPARESRAGKARPLARCTPAPSQLPARLGRVLELPEVELEERRLAPRPLA